MQWNIMELKFDEVLVYLRDALYGPAAGNIMNNTQAKNPSLQRIHSSVGCFCAFLGFPLGLLTDQTMILV